MDLTKDLTKGNIPGQLLSLALPTSFGFLAQTLYDLVDIMWIGRINQMAVAGVTIFTSLFWLVEVLNEVVGTSSISMISQSYGAGDRQRTARVIEQTIVFKILLACLAAAVLLIFLRPLMTFFNKDRQVLQYALDYGYLRIFFLPLFFTSFTVNTALRSTGDARTPMYILLFSSVLNILLDPLLIFSTVPGTRIPGLGLGVFGAALATVISISLASLIGLLVLFFGRAPVRPRLRGLLSLDLAIDGKLLSIGLPTGLEMLTRHFAILLVLKLAGNFGTPVQAALGIGFRLWGMVLLPLIGLLMGGSTLVGQNLGAEKVQRAVQTARWSLFYAFLGMSLVTLAFFFSAEGIMRFFINDPQVIEIGISMIRLISLGFLSLAIVFGLGVVFPGSGNNLPMFISGAIAKWAVQIPFLIIGLSFFPQSVEVLWLSFLAADTSEGLIVILFYRLGRWKQKRV